PASDGDGTAGMDAASAGPVAISPAALPFQDRSAQLLVALPQHAGFVVIRRSAHEERAGTFKPLLVNCGESRRAVERSPRQILRRACAGSLFDLAVAHFDVEKMVFDPARQRVYRDPAKAARCDHQFVLAQGHLLKGDTRKIVLSFDQANTQA